MVERFFRDLTDKRIRRGIFRNVQEVIDAIDEYVFRHNDDPKPFIWTKKASDILAKVMRQEPLWIMPHRLTHYTSMALISSRLLVRRCHGPDSPMPPSPMRAVTE